MTIFNFLLILVCFGFPRFLYCYHILTLKKFHFTFGLSLNKQAMVILTHMYIFYHPYENSQRHTSTTGSVTAHAACLSV